jgi:hypothetical protein
MEGLRGQSFFYALLLEKAYGDGPEKLILYATLFSMLLLIAAV